MICKAANTWLDSGKEQYVDELSQIKPQEASKLEESLLSLGGEAKGTFATSLMRVETLDLKFSLEREVLSVSGTGEPSATV
jgi:hypothetical protein